MDDPKACKNPAAVNALLREVDCHVGRRLRVGRLMAGLSQTELGSAIDTVFQQIQKYENGSNRIPASALFRLAQALKVPVSFFYEGLPEDGSAGGGDAEAVALDPLKNDLQLLPRRESIELVRSYSRIRDPRLRRGIYPYPVHERGSAVGAGDPPRAKGNSGRAA